MGATDPLDFPIVFFDGVCNLCNASVAFIIKRDKKKMLRFASLQSDFARVQLPHELTTQNAISSIILLVEGKVYKKSTAALRITKYLRGLWPVAYIFVIVPRFIRDGVYNFIAKNRYKWFGKRQECLIPSPDLADRFIE